MPEHRWSGWPGAWCLDCGEPDPREEALADGIEPEQFLLECREPGSKRHDPYAGRHNSHVMPKTTERNSPMPCPLCNDTGNQRYWEGRWRDEVAENRRLRVGNEEPPMNWSKVIDELKRQNLQADNEIDRAQTLGDEFDVVVWLTAGIITNILHLSLKAGLDGQDNPNR